MNGTMTSPRSCGTITTNIEPLFCSFVAYVDGSEQTTATYLRNLRQFAKWLYYRNITRPEQITRETIIEFRDDMLTRCKPGTVSQYLRTVKAFISWGTLEDIFPKDFSRNVKPPKIKKVIGTPKKKRLQPFEVLEIEESIRAGALEALETAYTSKKDSAGKMARATEQGKRLFAMYLLAVNNGLRVVELSRARVKDLEIERGQGYLYIWGKGHIEADTRKPLAPEVLEALEDYLKSRSDKAPRSAPLFVSTGNRSGGKAIAPTTISAMLKEAMKEAGYNSERITAHSLRHTAAQNALAASGNNIIETQLYMRHESPRTTEEYIETSQEIEQKQIDLAIAVYDRYHQGSPAASDHSGKLPEERRGKTSSNSVTKIIKGGAYRYK